MMIFSKSTVAAAVLAAVSFAPLTASAALFDDNEARRAILDVRTRMDTLQREVNTRLDSKANASSTLELANQNEQLRQEVAKLRGQLEVLANELANEQRRQKDFYVDLDGRLRKLEPQKMNVDGKEANIEPSEQKSYDTALATFKAGDYKGAGAAFYDFLRRYPQSGYAASAQYWLGNSYYAQRDYKNAINAQQAVVKNYPDSPKASDALLNIASSYTELKDKSAAKRTLESLVAKYPDTPAAQTAKERLSTAR
ncbi:tol-pal system protein YbgF [Undibacterium arcticum]|uniref:Cell division coordinator CpoB n=1 Tax=Undibacterium arcticum TaxID=1762892 RepID=A0ABV7F2K1_9BURK